MQDREKPSWFIRIFGPLIFIMGAIGALSWFFYRILSLFEGLTSDVVAFDKGSYYALGVGVGLLAIAFAGVQETWLGKPLTKKSTSIISKLAIAGVVLMLSVPHISHYALGSYLKKNGYAVCEEASHQWLFVRNIVYVQKMKECSKDMKNN